MKITISELYIEGKFNPKKINLASFDELYDWQKSILLGDEPYFRIEEVESPHGYIQTIFHKLDPQTRGSIEDIIIEFLRDMVFNEKTEWVENSADELLLLIPDLFLTSQRTTEPIRLLLIYTSQRKEEAVHKRILFWRVLQTLVRLKYRGNPEFWYNLYSFYGDEIADLVFAGLTLTDIKSAFAWLEENHSNQKVVHSLIIHLPYLVKEFGINIIQDYLLKFMCIINDANKKRIYRISTRLGFELYPPILINLSENIDLFAHSLQYVFPEATDTVLEKVMNLDLRINADFPIEPNKYKNLSADLIIINGVSRFIEKNTKRGKTVSFPRVLRENICNYAETLKKDMDAEDQETLSFDQAIIEITGVDFSSALVELRVRLSGNNE